MAILITGASGAVGKILKPRLEIQGYDIYTPTHDELDLSDYYKIHQYFSEHTNITTTIHLAVSKPHYYTNNTEYNTKIEKDIYMALNVMFYSKRTILLTSGSIYGRIPPYKVKEQEVPSLGKLGDVGYPKRVVSYFGQALKSVIELRPFGIYGPGELSDRLPTFCFNRIREGKDIEILDDREMSYIYVHDLCYIIEYFVENNGKYTVYNVANPTPITTLEMGNRCIKVAEGCGTQIESYIGKARHGRGVPYVADISRLLEEIPDWEPTPIDEGLKELYVEICKEK